MAVPPNTIIEEPRCTAEWEANSSGMAPSPLMRVQVWLTKLNCHSCTRRNTHLNTKSGLHLASLYTNIALISLLHYWLLVFMNMSKMEDILKQLRRPVLDDCSLQCCLYLLNQILKPTHHTLWHVHGSYCGQDQPWQTWCHQNVGLLTIK